MSDTSAQSTSRDASARDNRDRGSANSPGTLTAFLRLSSGLGSFAASCVFIYNTILQIVAMNMHNHDVVVATNAPVIEFLNDYILFPLAKLFRSLSVTISSVLKLHLAATLQDITFSRLAASIILTAIALSILYFSVLGLLRIYGSDSAYVRLRRLAFIVISIILLPFAMLSIVHVVQNFIPLRLLPVADNVVADYVTITRSLAGAVYGWIVPLHIPLWLKDAAAISIISVGIYRKAWLQNEVGNFELDWDKFFGDLFSWFHGEEPTVFDVLVFVPETISVLLAFVVGRLLQLVRLGWIAERAAALTFVILRGIMLVGLIYPFDNLYLLVKTRGDESPLARHYRIGALWYMAYFGITMALVTWFFATLSYVSPLHSH